LTARSSAQALALSQAKLLSALLTEAPDGGGGLSGHANTNEELVTAARHALRGG